MRKKQLKDKPDFTEKDLPKTRRAQFFQIIKDNYSLLVIIGLILLAFLIPLLVAIFIKYSLIASTNANTGLDEETRVHTIYLVQLIFNAIYVPCFMLFFVAFGGVLKVFRRLIWNEPLFAVQDFFRGIKENILSYLFIGFLVGAIYFLIMFVYHSLSVQLIYISFIIAGISLAIVIPILLTACYLNSIYMTNIFTNIAVAARLFIRRGIFILLILLPLYGLYFLSLIPVYIIIYILILAMLFIFLLPLIFLASYLNSIKNMDDYINKVQYPEQAYLGLYHPDKDKEDK